MIAPPTDIAVCSNSASGIRYHTYHQRPHEAFQGPILVIDHKRQVCLRHPYAADLNCGRHWQCGKTVGDGLLAVPGFDCVKGRPTSRRNSARYGPFHNVVVRLVALSANTRATGPSLAMRSYSIAAARRSIKAHPIEMTVPWRGQPRMPVRQRPEVSAATAGACRAARVRRALRSRAAHALAPRRLRGCREPSRQSRTNRNIEHLSCWASPRGARSHERARRGNPTPEGQRELRGAAGAAAAGVAARPRGKHPPLPEIPPRRGRDRHRQP